MLKPIHLPAVIKSARVTARQITTTMNDELFRVIDDNREHLREYLYWVDGTKTPADELSSVELFVENWNNGSGFVYVLFDENEQIIGTVDVHGLSYGNNLGYFGYWLKKSATRRGYLSEIFPFIEEEFFKLGIHRMVIECLVENTASANVAIRAGYIFEGISREALYGYGQYHDIKVFSKIAS